MCLIRRTPGGYCKEYSKGKRPIGIMLDDTWFLRRESRLESPAFPVLMCTSFLECLSTQTPMRKQTPSL